MADLRGEVVLLDPTKPLHSERVDELQQRPERRARGEDAVEYLGEFLVFAFVVEREHQDVLEFRGKLRRGSVNCGECHGLAPALTACSASCHWSDLDSSWGRKICA
jgi:hypothetical protein